jgi:uncharacterized membrane protein
VSKTSTFGDQRCSALIVASLIAVDLVLVRAEHNNGRSKALLVSLNVARIVLAWGIVHSRVQPASKDLPKARLEASTSTQNGRRVAIDFAYLSLTIRMTFQVSDTNLKTSNTRRPAVRTRSSPLRLGC